jgi:hypothetical protein
LSAEASKLTIEEAWESTAVFHADPSDEDAIDQEMNELARDSMDRRVSTPRGIDMPTQTSLRTFLFSESSARVDVTC